MDPDFAEVLRQRRHRSWLLLAWTNSVMAWLLILAAIMAASCARPRPHRAQPATGLSLDQQSALAVRIDTACVSGDIFGGQIAITGGSGSGLIVDIDHVLTASHVVECKFGAPLYIVQAADGARRQAHLRRHNLKRDLAELEVDIPFMGALPIVVTRPRLGESVCMTTSMPTSDRKCGIIDHLGDTELHDKTVDVAMRAEAIPGNSGSPMWDAAGRLVCVVTNQRRTGGWCSSVDGHIEL